MNPSIETIKSIAREASQLLLDLFEKKTDSAKADVASQDVIVKALAKEFSNIPILAEERMEGIDLLPADDSFTDLPPTYWSVDPLDGSAVFDNECSEWAVSIALVENHELVLSVVYFPCFNMIVEAEAGKGCKINGSDITLNKKREPEKWLLGIDLCKSTSDELIEQTLLSLIKKFRYVRNFPGCASGLEVLLGHTGLYVTDNHRNWDFAGMSLAIQEAGGIVQQLDGKPIDWRTVRLQPFFAAANEKVAILVNS